MFKNFIPIAIALSLLGCDQKGSIDSTKERAKAEGEANREVENKNLADKAQKMEVDLAQRHYFYNAIEGEFEGDLNVGNDTYKMKLTFARSIPPYAESRVRELSEIENDLNNLYFHTQAVQWHPADPASAVGCRISGIRPNMEEGNLFAASSDCPNFYSIFISEGGPKALVDKTNKAKNLSEKIRQRSVSEVQFLVGTIQPSSIALKYTFTLKRLK